MAINTIKSGPASIATSSSASVNPAPTYLRMSDQLTKYLFADKTVRAQTINLQQTWQDVHSTHGYPPAVVRLLGELVAASALLSANLKFDGTLLLQLQGDGDILLVVVECRSDLTLRATVKIREGAQIPAEGNLQTLLNPGGNG